jgi:hypothetical protein
MMNGDEEYQRLATFLDRPLIDSRDPNLYRNRAQAKVGQLAVVKYLLPFLPAQPQQVFQALEEKRADSIAVRAELTADGDQNETR